MGATFSSVAPSIAASESEWSCSCVGLAKGSSHGVSDGVFSEPRKKVREPWSPGSVHGVLSSPGVHGKGEGGVDHLGVARRSFVQNC